MLFYLLITIVALCVFLWKFLQWTPFPKEIASKNRLVIWGHRGYPAKNTENTLPSFKEAIAYGVDGIELDVQWSLDKKLVVFHDFDLSSLGIEKQISQLLYSEIKSISLKAYNKTQNSDFYIPILKEVLELLPPESFVNIEIKSKQLFCNGIEQDVLDAVKTFKLGSRTLISSFNPLVLKKIKKLSPKLKTGYLWSLEDVPRWLFPHYWAYYCKPDTFNPDINFVTKKQVEWAKNKGMKVYAFTVNSDTQLQTVNQYKIDGVFTDDPALIKDNNK